MRTDEALRAALALLPVLMFLAALRVLDSYKLVSLRMVSAALAAGAAAAAICYGINTVVFQHLHVPLYSVFHSHRLTLLHDF